MENMVGNELEYINRHSLLPWAMPFYVLEGVMKQDSSYKLWWPHLYPEAEDPELVEAIEEIEREEVDCE